MVMSANRQALRSILALAGVIVVSLGRATAAVAAIDGGFTISQAQPGDRVTLTAQGPAGQTETVYMISTVDLDRQIARFGRQVCNTSGQYALGSFTWKGGIGSLTFTVPDAAAGRYYLQVKVREVSPDCWRIGSQGEPLVLTVLAATGANDVPRPAPLNPLAGLLLVGAAGVVIAVISRLTRRPA
jgi:hypothetical protein